MTAFLVTGGSGFLGTLLIERLLADGIKVTNLDLVPTELSHPNLHSVVGDVRNRNLLDDLLSQRCYRAAFHCASLLAHGRIDAKEIRSSNVDGARTLSAALGAASVPTVVYTSSNCLWGENFNRAVTEEDTPAPVEVYGLSKWEAEKVLLDPANPFAAVAIRCPTIMDEGRLGLLSILFEFIAENRRLWVVGDGRNRYQFIYAQDLINAMLASVNAGSNIFGIGSDNVSTMNETYQYVIDKSASRSRIANLPLMPTTLAMKAAHLARISPLGPYHYRMIASNFIFDTSRIKSALNWKPTLTNQEMMWRAYRYYRANQAEIYSRGLASAHRRPAEMGVIRLVKWMS